MYNTKLVFAAACLGMLIFGLSLLALGSVLPGMVAKFGVSELSAGALTSLLPFGILCGSLFFGPIADRYGYKALLPGCCLLIIAGLEGLAFGGSWPVIQGAVFLTGLGGGAMNGATSSLMADISVGEKGANLSFLGVFYGLGALGMPAIMAALSPYFTHEQILAGIGGFILLATGYLLAIRLPKSKHQQGLPIREGIRLIRNPVMMILSFVLFFESGVEGIVSNWTTSFLQSETGLAPNLALVLLTAHVAALAFMRMVLGFLLRFYPAFNVLLLSLFLALAGGLLLWLGKGFALNLTALILMGLGFAGVFPIMMGRIGDFWAKVSGTAFSIALVIALSGNILLNYLMGLLAHHYGMGKFPLLLMVSIGLLGLVVLRTRGLFSFKRVRE